jgi:uncharacterized membrane protein YhaH (DUF805 family)
MDWYLTALKQYATFSGRARRKEYWMFYLFNCIAFAVLSLVDGFLTSLVGFGGLVALYWLATLIPTIAVSVRRLHDVGKSGWWIFITLVPLVGIFWFLYYLVIDGNEGSNEYGANPKSA